MQWRSMKHCPLPLVALRGDETCPRCGRPAREHRGHPSYQETTMTETTEPTREQIEEIRADYQPGDVVYGLCSMALRTLDAEEDLDRARKLHASFPGSPLASEVIDGQARRLEEMASQLAAMTERAEKAERERHVAVSVMREMRVAWDGASDQRNDLRAKLAEVERERDEEGRLRTEWGALYTDMVRQRDDWHEAAHAADERAAVSSELREAAEAERDTMRAKLAERERYIAEQRAITEPAVQDLARQLREATERAEKAERLSATLRAVAEQEVADAIVKSRERATRVGWIDHATGDYEERAVTMLMDDLAAGSAVCAFLRMVGVWTLEDRAETAEREQDEATKRAEKSEREWYEAFDRGRTKGREDVAIAQRDAMRARLADAECRLAEVERERDAASFDAEAQKIRARTAEERLAEVERERDEERHLATVRGEMLSVYERRIAELSSRGNVIANRVFWIDHVTGDRCEHVTKSTFEDLMHIEAIATAFRMIAFDVIRAKLADAERRLVEVGRELLIKDAQIAEMRRAFGERYARLSNMHRRAQSAESRVAGWCREAIGQRKRADWWRSEAKRLGWTPDYPELREDPPSDARIDCESSSLLLLSTWARKVMMRPKNRAKGVPTQSILELLRMAWHELSEARWAISDDAPTDDILAELGDAAAIISFAMREVEKRRKA